MSITRARNMKEKLVKAQQVAQHLLGDPNNGIEPLTITETQTEMGFAKNDSVYTYKELAVEAGYLSIDQNGDAILPQKSPEEKWRIYSETHKLATDPLMIRYLDKESSKGGGVGVKMTQTNFNMLERFFNTVRITPKELVTNKIIPNQVIPAKTQNEVVEYWRDEFLKAFRNRTDWQRKKINRGSIQVLTLRLNYALVSFCSGHGITWVRGDPVMSRKIVGHAKYSNIRLTTEEFPLADQWIIDHYGLDSNLYRWFWVGVESCGRSGKTVKDSGLYGMKLQWDLLKSKSKSGEERTTFYMQMYESKTKNVKDGMWFKWIKRTKTQESLLALKKRGGTRIYQSDLSKTNFLDQMNAQLKELYTFLKKDPDSLFFKKPSHSLRHLGAHYWLSKGKYKNHVEVSKLGGWNTIDEMIKSYGEFPPEKMNEYLDEYSYE